MFPKKAIMISVIFLLYAYTGFAIKKSLKEAGAVIFSGHQFHHEGLAIEASLLQKGYDVFLTQVRPQDGEGNVLEKKDWSTTPLMTSLKDHYKKMLFIVTGHGMPEFGVNIAWDLLLKLIKELQTKADEIFIHVDTCFSGNIAEPWKSELGNNVKIFTTGSCHGNSAAFSAQLINHTNPLQIFTGYWMRVHHQPETPELEHTEEESIKKLNCDSTVQDVFKLLDRPCGTRSCHKIHIHKGGDEKLKNWNLLPKNVISTDQSTGIKVHNPVRLDESCIFEDIPFDKKEDILFQRTLNLDNNINTYDPVNAWRIRTVPVGFYYDKIQDELLNKNIPAYARILAINDKKCDIQNQQTCDDGSLSFTRKLQIAYHKNRNEVWELKFKKDDDSFPFYYIIVLIVVIVVIAVGIAICCSCCTKKSRTRRQRNQFMKNSRMKNQNFQQNQRYMGPSPLNQSQIQIVPSNYGQELQNGPRETANENTFIPIQ